MSVIIKGMEMPKNCAECKFLCSENFKSWCHVTDRDDVYVDAVPDWCPLAELPEKHGRLIDADALFNAMKYSDWKVLFSSDGTFLDISKFSEIIRNIPTIVEAEGEDER